VGEDLGGDAGEVTARSPTPAARLFVLALVLGPAALLAAAVSLRTAHVVESYRTVIERLLVHEKAARDAAELEGVDVALVLAVASAESAGHPRAVSRAGALGLMQLARGTADELAEAAHEPPPDLFDPATSLRLGARYLRRQMEKFQDQPHMRELAIAAYNAGPAAVQGWIDAEAPPQDEVLDWIRYRETRAFVRRVLDYEDRWRAELASHAAPPAR
jgi:soluble lytic murein transglycosylase-like protein